MKLRVGLIFGGKSGEHEVSIVSARSVYNALDKTKYEITLVGIDKQGQWMLPELSVFLNTDQKTQMKFLEARGNDLLGFLPFNGQQSLFPADSKTTAIVPSIKFDVVVPILHGTYGEDGTIQGLFELANVPYVGAGVLGSAIGMDKDVSKRLLNEAGISIVPYINVRQGEFRSYPAGILKTIETEIGFPCFVKPANAGSSVGVFKIKSSGEALQKIRVSLQYDNKVLVEKAISARELECSVLGNENPQASIIGEVIPRHEFYSYEAKYLDPNGAELAIPAKDLTRTEIETLQNISKKAFNVLECSGMARVDFFMDKDSRKIYLNEINTIPGFTSISQYPKLWEASGLKYSQLLDKLIQLALDRHKLKNQLKTTFEPS